MRILIATPAYGGLVSTKYLLSFVETFAGFRMDNIDYSLLAIDNESLISRARNLCAYIAMAKGFDKMMFIDADIGWKYKDMRRLLFSEKKIIGGTYPLKTLPISLNFNPLPQHMDEFEHRKSLEDLKKYKKKHAAPNGEVEVMHLPTGFLLIDTSVFHALKEHVLSYSYIDYHTKEAITMYDFFPVRVHKYVLESEDWAFCSTARKHGFKVYFNTNSIVSHAGTYIFQATQG